MPPKKLPAKKPQALSSSNSNPSTTANPPVAQNPQQQTSDRGNNGRQPRATQEPAPRPIPEQDIKQGSSASAQMALEAGKKAYELRQAAYAAGDPDAREEILGKAINKEIEAEAFGKAAKYTRSGAFQGLAAGAGMGIQPGAFIGKVTGAIVGGLLSTIGGLLGGGIGSAYGAINGPIWDIGAMASHGARSVIGDFIGDFPDFGKSTKHQKDTLEKMILGAKDTPKPSRNELLEMKADDGGATKESYQRMAQQMTSYMPQMPDMSKMSQNMPNMPEFGSLPKHMPLMQSLGGLMGGQQQAGAGNTPSQPPQVTANKPVQKSPSPNEPVKKKAPKLEVRSKSNTSQKPAPAPVKKAPKLETRSKPATASA